MFTHKDAELLRIRATEIPYRCHAAGELTWRQYDYLQEKIESIVWQVFNKLRYVCLGEESTLCFFQEAIFKQVKELLLVHGCRLSPEDEARFKTMNSNELLQSKKT